MSKYDLSLLDPIEFESLSNDLMEIISKTRVERFKPGKDQGIDGRFFCHNSKKSCIIQSKHYIRTGLKGLLNHIAKKEYKKIKKLSPDRYILWTSVPLNAENKNSIMKALTPFVISPADIYGESDINSLIESHNSIERKYYKLWIKSSDILLTYIHKDIYEASKSEILNMRANTKYYAQTSIHSKAYDKLQKEHVVVITGDAGIGKTTLAEQLCIASMSDGYECFIINDDTSEGFKVIQPDSKQIFYFDDFLGSNYLSSLEKNEDSNIIRFIRTIKSQDKRLILTSRANILDQSYLISTKLSNSTVKDCEYVININDYTQRDKSLILYNMLWRSSLPEQLFEAFLDLSFFNKTINHQNFNPRIIEVITNNNFINEQEKEISTKNDFIEFIIDNLNNPYRAFDNSFSCQIDECGRILTMLIIVSGMKIDEHTLNEAYTYYVDNYNPQRISNIAHDTNTIARQLCRTFITRHIDKLNSKYGPFNPSVTDYIINKIKSDTTTWHKLLKSLNTVSSLTFFIKSNKGNTNLLSKVSTELATNPRTSIYEQSIEYITKLGNILPEDIFNKTFDNIFLNRFTLTLEEASLSQEYAEILDFTKRLLEAHKNIEPSQELKIYTQLINLCVKLEDFSTLSRALSSRNIKNSDLSDTFQEQLISCLEDTISDIAETDINDYATDYRSWDEDGEIFGFIDTHPEKLVAKILQTTDNLFIPLSKDIIIEIVDSVDIEEIYDRLTIDETLM